MYLFVAWLGCLFPELTEALVIVWLLVVADRLS